ncbi:MAG TPA: DUF3574 domain-containing protein [Gemmatimonadales bacterium]
MRVPSAVSRGSSLLALALAAGALAVTVFRPAAASSIAHCAIGDTTLVRDILYFGRNTPGGAELSDSVWQRYVDEVLTPRFPAGLTIWDAAGQWRGASGKVERERSKVLTLLHSGDVRSDTLVAEAVGEYKRRFDQEAVLRERVTTCSRF